MAALKPKKKKKTTQTSDTQLQAGMSRQRQLAAFSTLLLYPQYCAVNDKSLNYDTKSNQEEFSVVFFFVFKCLKYNHKR